MAHFIIIVISFILSVSEKEEKKEEEEVSEKGCPNVSNPYHTCVEYCVKRWGAKLSDNENEKGKVSINECAI